jgi:Cft2 family RNA processing exonuclease
VFKCKSFSSHADNDELIQVIASAKPDKTFLVHGEMSSKLSLKQSILEQKLTNEVVIPTAKGKKHYPAGRK